MGGAGMLGSGGVGVGGWQLYEGVINPTTHRQLTNQGYTWNPAEVPLNDAAPEDNKQFKWEKWDSCTKKLFPNLTVNYTESTATTNAPSYTTLTEDPLINTDPKIVKNIYFDKPTSVTDDLLSCALFDWRGNADGSRSKIYFKSEVAVKDTNHGWIMWSGLSNTPSSNKGSITLEHRLLILKKNNANWEIDKGFGWSNSSTETTEDNSSDEELDYLHIILPQGHNWNTTKTKVGTGYSTRRVWSGIATVDRSSRQHLVESLDIHLEKKGDTDAEESRGKKYSFWGVQGKWTETNAGYDKANRVYDASAGWKTISAPIDLKDTLTEWYKPYRGNDDDNNAPNVIWTTCDSWSRTRGKSQASMTKTDEAIRDVCYTKR